MKKTWGVTLGPQEIHPAEVGVHARYDHGLEGATHRRKNVWTGEVGSNELKQTKSTEVSAMLYNFTNRLGPRTSFPGHQHPRSPFT